MENGKYQISFAPIYGQKTKEEEEVNDTQDALDSVDNLECTKLENAEIEDAEENKIEKPVKVSYESQQKECTFSYKSLNTGIKESVVLTKAPEGNALKFRFKASGLVPKKNVLDGGISFLDEKTDEIVAALEAPNMNDATGKAYSEKISYDIELDDQEKDSYILTLHLDEEYFKDKDRKYPVTIDPTVSWTGSTDFWDVYVINGSYKDTNFYDNGVYSHDGWKVKTGCLPDISAF